MIDEEGNNLPADAPWWARWMIAEWKNAWKWIGTWYILLLGSAAELQAFAPDYLAQYVDPMWSHHIMAVIAFLALIAKLKKKPE